MLTFDRSLIEARLERLDRHGRTAFAALCAERLLPLFTRYSIETGDGSPSELRKILDRLWAALDGSAVADLSSDATLAASMVPDEDGPWTFVSGYGQNAAASVAYAVQTWQEDSPEAAVWAAWQVYEVADYAEQSRLDNGAVGPKNFEPEPNWLVEQALSTIQNDLNHVEFTPRNSLGSRDNRKLSGSPWLDLLSQAAE